MAQRRFGPTQGAGVAVIEQEGGKPIQPAALGWVGYAGILERGPVGELIVCPNKATFKRKCGGYISDSLLPDNCFHFFDVAQGAGGIVLVRVTDGDEEQAVINLYSRKVTRTPMGQLKAKNGGKWAGQEDKLTGDVPNGMATDLTNITIDTGVAMKENEWTGGVVELPEVVNTQYPIISNDTAGVITVAADQTMKDDYDGVTGSSDVFYLSKENATLALSVEIRDGEENASTEFGIFVYLNGDLVRSWPNLHTDPTSARYWLNLVNNDDLNEYVEAVDSWTGAHVADVRPANHFGDVVTVTETVMTADLEDFVVNSPLGGDATGAVGTTTDVMDVPDTITCTFTDLTTFDVVSAKWGVMAVGETLGVETISFNKWTPPFTLTAGANPMAAADTIVLNWKPFVVDSLIGGFLYPDKANEPRERYIITDNDHDTITCQAGSDLTASGAPGTDFMVVAPLEMAGGLDGNVGVGDAQYLAQAWNLTSSPFDNVADKGYGLVKYATPGINTTAVQQGGKGYAEAKNHQYRYEVPDTTLTETSVDAYINDTLGRSDFAVVSFPSYGYVTDPEAGGEAKLKLVPLTGMIHGRESRIAADYDGYHKAGAGIDATLPALLKLTTEDAILDEEYLNPKGINIIKKKLGNFILWGDRTLWVDINWKWKHQREMMTYYEHVLMESFDWIVFAINDPVEEKRAVASMKSFFFPEWVKRALRGDTFEEAASIKIDAENNTDATRAAGDMYADVLLRLADTVERFIIRIGKAGIFESVG